ncbi:uncharacterized protein EDB93DRAFT_75412 [Suillus bovinus]|uniref:uncharacterized protein n=1 Tax=Suillus bovinus TaxID=48563 RepID=UPI001B87C4AC|nr:uncharacterized protein EDB93DRAFT_75412 [Suillus bovinus]KAG2130654.1 hypothetical protein EDB93DRAFT_75412 [Suillus bovinus]
MLHCRKVSIMGWNVYIRLQRPPGIATASRARLALSVTLLLRMDALATQSVTIDSLYSRQAVTFVAIASFTLLCWDHMITFADEVALIWCQPKKPAAYLFILNRYITPLGFIVNIVALTLPNWSTERYVVSDLKTTGIKLLLSCRNFVRYQAAMAIIGVSIAELIMLIRVHALHQYRTRFVAVAGLLLLVQVALEAYLIALGKMVPHVQQIHSCYEVYDLPPALSVTRAWLPLAYDTVIFIMTLWRTLPSHRDGSILQTFQTDVRAPLGLKGVAAQLVFLLTVVVTSRVTLHLKKQDRSFVIRPPTVFNLAHGHQQMSRKPFDDDLQPKLPFSTTPIPSITFDPTDDAQSFRSVDEESQ